MEKNFDAINNVDGNSYTTEFRQYDPRLGRWMSRDPLAAQFPWQSPYCAFDNKPVLLTDPSGLASEGGPGDPPTKAFKIHSTFGSEVAKSIRILAEFMFEQSDEWLNAGGTMIEEITVVGQKGSTGKKESKPNMKAKAIVLAAISASEKTTEFLPKNNYTFYNTGTIEFYNKYLPEEKKFSTSGFANYFDKDDVKELQSGFRAYQSWEQSLPVGDRPSCRGNVQPCDGFWQAIVLAGPKGGLFSSTVAVSEEVATQTFVTETIAGFYVRSSTSVANGVYTRTIQTLANNGDKSLFDLVRAFEVEAAESGANQVVINGIEIVETRLINEGGARLLGYSFEQTSANSIKLTKMIK
jgi:RHS repeat-associated protein